MNAQREASERLGRRREVRVLEPSPPAVDQPPWFADDPVVGGEVVPVERPGSSSWDSVCRGSDDGSLAPWCADRWLGAWRPLPEPPPALAVTRAMLHALAEQVLAPARQRATGKIGLRYTRRGFGTPFYGPDRQARVDDGVLVVQQGDDEQSEPLTTIAAAAQLVGVTPGAPVDVYSPATDIAPDASLEVDRDGASFLGQWFGFAASVLEQLRAEASAADAPSRVQLWPEHFDIAVDLGDDAAGHRASFGASPGDADHVQPYVYITPWSPPPPHPFFGESHFRGARLGIDELRQAPDHRGAALAFLREGKRILDAGGDV